MLRHAKAETPFIVTHHLFATAITVANREPRDHHHKTTTIPHQLAKSKPFPNRLHTICPILCSICIQSLCDVSPRTKRETAKHRIYIQDPTVPRTYAF